MCQTKSSASIARPSSELGRAWNHASTSCLLSDTTSPFPSAGESGSVTHRVLSMRGSDPVPFPTIASPQLRHDPALDEWRREDPVRRIQLPYGRWCWVVTRHADVKLVLTDPRFSRRAAGQDDAPRKTPGVVQRGSLASMDGADHARLRRLVSRAL